MSIEACRNCRFWKLDEATHGLNRPVEDGDIAFGWCRRRAPVVKGELAALAVPRTAWCREPDSDEELSSTQVYRASVQPVSESDDWCGDYQAAPTPAAAAEADAPILAAFDEWKAAREFIATNVVDADDKPQWAIVDRVQALLAATTVNSPAAAEAALWVALDDIDDSGVHYPHIRNRDIEALLAEASLQWPARLITRSIASLRAMAEA